MPLAALTSGSQNDPLMAKLVSQLPALPGVPNLAPFQQQKQQIQKQQQQLTAPTPPQLQQIPQDVPKAQVTDAFSQMSMPMLFLATLAGGLTAHPMQGAFQNAASYLQGLHQGDQEATKNAYTEFTTKLNAAKDANAQAVDQYKMAFEKYGADSEKLKSELSSIADAEGDTVLKHQLEQGQFDDVYKLIDARDRLNTQLQNHQDMLQLRIDGSWKPTTIRLNDGSYIDGEISPYAGYRDATGKPIDSANVAGVVPGVSAASILTPQDATFAAKMAWKGDWKDAVSMTGYGSAANINRTVLRDAITKEGIAQGKNGDDIAGLIAQYHGQLSAAATIGRITGSTAQGAQELQQIIPLVQQASDKIDRTEFPTINAVELAVRRGTGDPDVVQLNGYIQTLRNAYAQVMTRGGRMTDAARGYAREMIDGTLSTDQIGAALDAISNEAAVAQSSAARASQEVTGQPVTAPQAVPSTGSVTAPKSLKWDDLK